MAERGRPLDIDLGRLQLNLGNPRFEPVQDRDAAITALLQTEEIVELARDIVKLGGINPLERMGVYPTNPRKAGRNPFYTAAEGNRRLCALILLDDPEAVPLGISNRKRLVKTFEKLAGELDEVGKVPCIVFSNMDYARPWLERLHNGSRLGTGRRRWTPEQQARNTSDNTNRAATQLRDFAIASGFVTAKELARTTTTQQRFIQNSRFRLALGVVKLEDGLLERVSCWSDFEIMLRHFMSDVAQRRLNSRTHNESDDIDGYARQLAALNGLSRRLVEQGPLERREDEFGSEADEGQTRDGRRREAEARGGANNGSGSTRTSTGGVADDSPDDFIDDEDGETDGGDDSEGRRARPRRRREIGLNEDILDALHRVGNQKLLDLYVSLATIQHPKHTLLAVVGCWSFFECLTRAHGRLDGAEFVGYITGKVRDLGVEATPDRRVRKKSLEWIADGGNITKHDWQGASYDPSQLFNAMDCLAPIVLALLNSIPERK